jgi:xylulokinase
MPTPAWLGLDLGTSSLKALLLRPDGRVLGEGSAAYATATPAPGHSEQDPEDWWRAAAVATRAAVAAAEAAVGPVAVRAIGLSGQMHTFVLLNDMGEPLHPAITWMDTRAAGLLPELEATLARHGLLEALANPVVVGLTLPPLVWLARERPEVLAHARTLLLAKDYLRHRLTGTRASEVTDASATLLFDVAARRWAPRVLEVLGIDPGILPPLVDSAGVAGALTPTAAAQLGLCAGIPVAAGAGDAFAAALALGSVDAGDAQLTVGTGAQPALVTGVAPVGVPAPGLHAFCHLERWWLQASVNSAGGVLAWVRNLWGVSWEELYGTLEGAPPVAPLFLPYLSGERAPLLKGHARGAWLGLAPEHTPRDLQRSAVAGVVVAVAEGMSSLPGLGHGPVRAAGGGLRDARFAQALADAAGVALEVREVASASAVGAALLAGVAIGEVADLRAAAKLAPGGVAARYRPRREAGERWRVLRARFAALAAAGVHELVGDP